LIDTSLLLHAYAIGVFPMADSRDAPRIFWVEPRRRAILPLDELRVSRSLRKTIRSDRFQVTRDRAFQNVVLACAKREETWINAEIEDSYLALHKQGFAHSVECWEDGELVGGLYGVRLGAAFFGESMFARSRDASKVALTWLVARLRLGGFQLLDCQFMTDHLRSLGAVEISQKDYVSLLSTAVGSSASGLGDAAGAGGGAAVVGPDFGALDARLAGEGVGDGVTAPGCVILQLLGQTS
jgi:leucyl/phenylalanyl-tRNA---protein transferase